MDNNNHHINLGLLIEELTFLQEVIHSLPAFVYINEIEQSGRADTFKTIWMNQSGLELAGYSMDEIIKLGNEFYKELIHPDDLGVIPKTVEIVQKIKNGATLSNMYRIRSKGENTYRLMYSHAMVLSRFDDATPRRILSVCFEITEAKHCDQQLLSVLKEINRINHQPCNCCFTKREKEILYLIILGNTDKEIGLSLGISKATAKKHRANLIHKTKSHNSAELVAFAKESGAC